MFTKLIERNTTIPTRKSQIFSTAEDNQPAVDIHVLQGERQMAADNVTLGRFKLDGIAPAPRGVPQIEVTFDIDANGIVNVSAKDLGTGKEQKITITASTNLTDEEIEKKIKEAEQFAEEDKRRKEAIETKNQADSLIYQSEKTLKEMKGKISPEEETKVKKEIEKLKKAIESDNVENIKKSIEDLSAAFAPITQKMYEQSAQAQQTEEETQSENTVQKENVVDAEYEVVDEDESTEE